MGNLNRGFITDRYKALMDGVITISRTIREWQREQEIITNTCVFCGSPNNLQADHLIPISRGGDDSADNMVFSCQVCNASRNNRGIFEWLGLKEKDNIHRLVAVNQAKSALL